MVRVLGVVVLEENRRCGCGGDSSFLVRGCRGGDDDDAASLLTGHEKHYHIDQQQWLY
ncbi:unnamed protein product [Camellia sinensis]